MSVCQSTKVEFGSRHSDFQPVTPTKKAESTPWLPTGARRGNCVLLGPPPSLVLATRSRSEERERSESENEQSLGSPASSTTSPRLPRLGWGATRDEYLAAHMGAVVI